jgi:DNA-binding response OmpR family regulator
MKTKRTVEQLILIVEDDADIRQMLCQWLEIRGYRSLEAKTGREAFALATCERPDLVLMDLKIPDGNGIATTRQLREVDSLKGVPIVIISALRPDLFEQPARAVGADAFLPKPIDLKTLDNLIDALLSSRSGKRRIRALSYVTPPVIS